MLWNMALLKLDVSLSFKLLWGSKSCSLFHGIVFKLSTYTCWLMLIDISSFCLMLMQTYVKVLLFSART